MVLSAVPGLAEVVNVTRAYSNKRTGPRRLATIQQAAAICEEYAAQGLFLTVRQLFYEHVARGLVPNSNREYKRLQGRMNYGRLAGLIDRLGPHRG